MRENLIPSRTGPKDLPTAQAPKKDILVVQGDWTRMQKWARMFVETGLPTSSSVCLVFFPLSLCFAKVCLFVLGQT